LKAIIKLLIAAAILNGTVRAGAAAWSYYQFKDAAEQTLIFGATATTDELHDAIVRRAMELDLPVDPQNVAVTRDGPRTLAEASYTQAVELFPRYEYPFTFSFTVDSVAIKPATTRP
jgi:hypothetical protein